MGSNKTIAEVRKILQEKQKNGRHSFIEACEKTMPKGHLSENINLANSDIVVYDTEAYTYSTILGLLDNSTGRRLRLGTYSSKTKKLILEELIFDYEEIISKR